MDKENRQAYFVLVYSDRDDSRASASDKGLWCAIDDASGGYPYATDQFVNAKVWTSLARAKQFQEMFPFLDVKRLFIRLKPA